MSETSTTAAQSAPGSGQLAQATAQDICLRDGAKNAPRSPTVPAVALFRRRLARGCSRTALDANGVVAQAMISNQVKITGLRPEISSIQASPLTVTIWAEPPPRSFRRIPVARCMMEWLMRDLGLDGERRGRRVSTTRPGRAAIRPADLLRRQFTRGRPAVG